MLNKDRLSNFCLICGFDQGEPPWGEDGNSPSYCFCPCCGVEFGYQDSGLSSVHKYRKNWLLEGSNWFKLKFKPLNWSLEEQLKNIPDKYK